MAFSARPAGRPSAPVSDAEGSGGRPSKAVMQSPVAGRRRTSPPAELLVDGCLSKLGHFYLKRQSAGHRDCVDVGTTGIPQDPVAARGRDMPLHIPPGREPGGFQASRDPSKVTSVIVLMVLNNKVSTVERSS